MTPELNKQDLEALLRPELGNDLVVESFTSKPLTQPGENYGSTMLAIEVTINEGSNKQNKNLSLVAKLPPPSEFLWKLFDPPNTFRKEIICYKLVKTEYEKLQREKNVPKNKFFDIFPKCYGARTTLTTEIGDKGDKHAAILLQNLKTVKYQVLNRKLGVDLKHAQLTVSSLARFHALSVALKILKPQVFKETVFKACIPHERSFDEEEMKLNTEKLMNVVKEIPDIEEYLDRIRKASHLASQRHLDRSLLPPHEPYATISHTDLWVNNMLFCNDPNNESIPLHVKFIDFQGVVYASPVKDLLFFLYTSTAEGVLAKNFFDLIKLYHNNFTDCLKGVGCDIEPFSFQSFLEEMDAFAPSETEHILFMLMVICADKSDGPETLSGVDLESLYRKPNDVFKRKAREFIIDYVKRGWL